MPKLPEGQLSKHPTKGYRMTCGTYVGSDGKRRPKVFWLGHDKEKALTVARQIRWSAPIAAAMKGWTKEYEQMVRATDTLDLIRQRFYEAEKLRQELAPHIPAPVIVQVPVVPQTTGQLSTHCPTPAAVPPTGPMLHAALDLFVKAVQSQNSSRSHKKTIADSVTAIKKYRTDCPLSVIDYAWLEKFTNELKARPLSRKKDSRTGKCMPIKPYTVKRLLQHLRLAVQWIGRQRLSPQFGGWHPPADCQGLFSVELKKLMTKTERDKAADGPDQLTVTEIKDIYRAACDSRPDVHPILLLLGLFAGLGQTELSTVRRDEFDLDAATFTHRRNKTSQKGVYWLPPELVTQLRAYFKKHKVAGEDLAFRTQSGQPLVTDASDAVRQAWNDWRVRSGVERYGLGFYALRRFFGDYATRFGGESVGDAALAHTAKSMRGKHYSGFREFDKVKDAGRKLYEELKAIGMFEKAG